MKTAPDVSIIIVHYKCEAYTLACLQSIVDHAGAVAYEVIVVDNASIDGIEPKIRSNFPDVRFVASEVNLGFAGANNLGVQSARGHFILFLNPDTELRPHALELLVSTLESNPKIGIAGARLLNSDGTLQTSSITAFPSILNQTLGAEWLRRALPRLPMWGMAALYSRSEAIAHVDAVSGACMIMPRDVVTALSGFSTNYFMYSEDLDLCLRATRAGWAICYVPTAIIVHHGGGSSQTREQSNYAAVMMKESLVQFFRRHRSAAYAQVFRASFLAVSILRLGALILASPACFSAGPRKSYLRSWRKWTAILSWSCRTQRWARQEAQNAGYRMASYQRSA
jgi:hypothetical protein